jgi:MFS family permease
MPYRSVLEYPGYRSLWLAQVVSALGSRLEEIAFVWLVLEVTGDPAALAFVVTITALPSIATALPAGFLADRWNRKYLLIGSDLVRAAVLPLIPLLAPRYDTMTVLIGVGVVYGIAGSFFGPARGAIIPNLVPEDELDEANGLSQLTLIASRALYIVGGALIALIGTYNVFLIDAATFLVSAVILLAIPSYQGVPDADEIDSGDSPIDAAVDDFRDAVGILREHRVLLPLLAMQLGVFFFTAPIGSIVMPVFSTQVFGGDSFTYGILYGSFYVGMFVSGGFLDDVMDWGLGHGEYVIWGTVLSGFFLALTGVAPELSPLPFIGTLLFHGLCGAATLYVQVAVQTLLQTIPPDDARGKLFSVMSAGIMAVPPISYAIFGPLVGSRGPILVLFGMGVALVVAGVVTAFTPVYGANVDADREFPGSDQLSAS